MRRRRLPATDPQRRDAPPARPHVGPTAGVLALQRLAGNAATRHLIARDATAAKPAPRTSAAPAPAAATFKLLVVDDGKTGLSDATKQAALSRVADELKRLTSASSVDTVKAGFDIEVVSQLQRGKARDIGRRSVV